ncbi:Fungalysin/Thermolysin Extracellular metalloproteinase 5 [Allomyces javanicus]|nr:Fungalysin/Thermolysin Extracellular metalloproteinase 5 [Allomyces javanicus]
MISSARKFAILFLLALIATQAITFVEAGNRKTKFPAISHNVYTTSVPVKEADGPTDPKAAVTAFLTKELKFPSTEFIIKDIVPVSNGVFAVYARQVINGLEVVNGDINVNVKNGQVISYGDKFYRGARPAKPASTLESAGDSLKTPADGFKSLAAFIGSNPTKVEVKETTKEGASSPAKEYIIDTDAAVQPVPVKQAYVQDGNNLKLVYSYQVKQEANWYHAHVNAKTGAVDAINDWVADAKYSVLPVGTENPDKGPIAVVDSSTAVKSNASPQGWHSTGSQSYTDTRGNNINAIANTKTASKNIRPDGGSALDFTKYKPDFTKAAETYTNAATAQLFYMLNTAHDLSYQYGFDEVSGNFQVSNFNKGGKGNDAVNAYSQDKSATDNADFGTPPDGQAPVTHQYIFTQTNPTRDGVYDLTIPFHEFMHGITNRLTGGPSNTDCLGDGESGGMGEGWGDVFGLWANVLKADTTRTTKLPMGAYVMGQANGIRTYPYSSDLKVCPNLYSYLAKSQYNEVHMAGEIWASLLLEVYWNLVDKYGYGDIWTADATKGNTLFLRLVFDGLKLQPCNPTFINARDAVLQADKNLTGGKNQCEIWKGFAKRGLGTKATSGFKDSFDVPAECSGATPTTTIKPTSTATPTKTATPTTTAKPTTTTKPTPTKTPTPTPDPEPCPWWDPWCDWE